jgi:dienelactone hydrolase
MMDDAFAALQALAAHPRADAKRIGILGFSKGGSVALYAAHERLAARKLPAGLRFALHVPFYPWCGNHHLRPMTTGAPILMLIGGADTYAGVAPCTEYAEKLKAEGGKVDVKIYHNAAHGFDGGSAYSIARGENHSRCIYDEQPDGSWRERTSGILTNDKQGRRIEAGHASALASCRTFGVSGGPDAAAAKASMADLKAAVRRHLLRN